MDTILHVVDIDAPQGDVYRVLSTGDGLAQWWSTAVEADEEVGGRVRFTFVGDFNPVMEITALNEPSVVEWRCVDGHDPWQGATLRFEIAPIEGGNSRLIFKQTYGKPIDDEAYGIYNYNWGYFMHSIKRAVEDGAGWPYKPG